MADTSENLGRDPQSSGSLAALQVKALHKFYGTGRSAYHVLRSLNMEVQNGSIYGLLGPSGCGKTTLLRCVLGRIPIQSGHILILGKPPGARGHSVPGKGVGYMPQEEELALKLTMKELMYYFGIIYQMKLNHIKERIECLKKFLELSTTNAVYNTLSGGEKRRVSLAIALLHEPPLLILDEPTVGLDALLRAKIWIHLQEITSFSDTTIIITTHYIEEARQANMVGLMRSGRLLVQSPPERLITTYGVTTLEEVFLKMSEEQDIQKEKITSMGASIQQGDEEPKEHTPLLSNIETVKYPSYFSGIDLGIPQLPKLANVIALSFKECLKFVRQPSLFFRVIIMSTLNIALFCFTYGQDIRDIKIYYNNYDSPYYSDFFNGTYHLGRSFLSHIDRDTIDLKLASDISDGIEKIEEGKAWGYFNIPKEYSKNFIERLVIVCESIEDGSPVSDVSGAAVELILDVTIPQMYYTINDTLNDAILLMRRDFLRNASIPEFYFNPLIQINNYVYGGPDLDYTDYFGSGLIAAMTIFMAITLTATNLITDRKAGLYDRTLVAGVSVIDVVTSQLVTYSIMVLLQVIPQTFCAIYVFDVKREGSIVLVVLIGYLAGICGISIGLVISTYVSNVAPALQLYIAISFPLLLIGGTLWPIESYSEWLDIVSHLTPITYPIEGIRSILLKGWGIGDEPVYLGIIVLIPWIVVFLTLTCLGLHFKKY
ncbi:ABC transporter G family member 20-like [Dysidea avara]|uniref:ABC transporter G family member 20-like n=1 Tax=Dysidea avara TaxID=196820 RepID=UPI0033203EEB